MGRIFAVHEYALKPDVDGRAFERTIREAGERGLLKLPGLGEHHFLRGVKGARKGSYTARWIFESREAWERLWGTPEHALGKQDYPKNWQEWEDEVLDRLLDCDPDKITFTDYEEV